MAQGWRGLSSLERFAALLNHFKGVASASGDPAMTATKAMSAATGIPAASIKRIYTQSILGVETTDRKTGAKVRAVKNSPSLESDAWQQAMRKARHRVTDHNRRAVAKKQIGPVARTPTTVVVPAKRQYTYSERIRGKSYKRTGISQWTHYDVEFLPEGDIEQMVADLFDMFMTTGEYNVFRFTFLADADEYPGESGFKDKDYRRVAAEQRYMGMGSRQFVFAEYQSGAELVEDFADEWATLMLKGALRIKRLYFKNDPSVAGGEPMQKARDAYNKKRGKKARRKKGDEGV